MSFRERFFGKKRNKKPNHELEKQQREFEEKGYFTMKNRARAFRSPYAKSTQETMQEYEKRSKNFTPEQRRLAREGRFIPR